MSVIPGADKLCLVGDIKGLYNDTKGLYKSLPVPGIVVGEAETMGASDGQTLNGTLGARKSFGGGAKSQGGGMKKKLRADFPKSDFDGT